jgi:hypothetical protein
MNGALLIGQVRRRDFMAISSRHRLAMTLLMHCLKEYRALLSTARLMVGELGLLVKVIVMRVTLFSF